MRRHVKRQAHTASPRQDSRPIARLPAPGAAGAADWLTREQTVYIVPTVVARPLKLPGAEVAATCERLAAVEQTRQASLEGVQGACWV